MTDNKNIYVRKCNTCGKGMNDGYLTEVGDTFCSDKCLFINGYTPKEYNHDYENGTCFYTEWDLSDNHGEYYNYKGEITEFA